jgi:hypothetical protein
MTPARSKILQDNHQLCDTVCHAAICSTRASPSPIKGGGDPLTAGGGGGRRIAAHLHISAHIHDIVISPQSNLRDLEASPPLLLYL